MFPAFVERAYSQLKVTINTLREQYDKLYGSIDYQGRTVVDIGADYGSTARFFLSKGARRVIAYESNDVLRERFVQELGSEPRIEINGPWNGEMPSGDVLKMDCEMCEYMLTEYQLRQFKQWAVGVHRPRRYMPKVLALQEMLIRNGGRMVADMGYEVLYVKS